MTMLQNQTSDALPNVLHDQGIPNTLDGIGVTVSPPRPWLRVGVIAAAIAALLALVVGLFGRGT